MTVYVDLPVIVSGAHLPAPHGEWRNVETCESKEEAVAWLRALFGDHAVDEDGKVCLLTLENELFQ